MTVQRLTLWDSSANPPNDAELVYRWSGYTEDHSVRSLLRYVETHGERLRRRYLAFIHDMGESRVDDKRIIDHLAFDDGLSYWWMTLIAEKSVFKSPAVTDAIRLLALEEIVIQQKPGNVRLVSGNRALHEALSGLCQRFGIAYEWRRLLAQSIRKLRLQRMYRALPQALRGLIFLVRYAYGRWPLTSAERSGWFGGSEALFFCSYFDNIALKAAARAQFRSHYWGGLHTLLHRMGYRSNWLQLFVPCAAVPDARTAVSWVRRFKNSAAAREKGFHTFPDAYLNGHLIFRVLKHWLRLVFLSWRLRKIRVSIQTRETRLPLWPILRSDWFASLRGAAAMSNLLWIELIDAAFRDLPYQRMGLYLCENQGWERALIHAWRKHGHGRLIGVVHSTVRYWDVRYFSDLRTIASTERHAMPKPDLVALNGKSAVDAFLGAGYPREAIVECEAQRYGYLVKQMTPRRSGGKRAGVRRVLVLGDVMPSATNRLLELLRGSVQYGPETMAYAVKPHPNCPVRVDDFPSLDLEIITDPLEKILADYDVVLASNTTSGALDAYLFGLPVVVMLDDTKLNISPLRGQPNVPFVSTPGELAVALRAAQHHDIVDRPDGDNYFFLDPALPRWSRLLAS